MRGRVSKRPEPGVACWQGRSHGSRREYERHGGLRLTCPYCAAIARIRALEEEWSILVHYTAYATYVDRLAPSDFTYVQGGFGNPCVTVAASTAELAEYCCFRATVITNRTTLYAFRRKPPLYWQSVRSFFWNAAIIVQLSTPATAINVDEDVGGGGDYGVEYASSDSSNVRDMVPVKTEEGWELMETDDDADSCCSEGAVIGSSP